MLQKKERKPVFIEDKDDDALRKQGPGPGMKKVQNFRD